MTACSACRTVLPEGATRCPNCYLPMPSREWIESRKEELLNHLRRLDPVTTSELESLLRAIYAFDHPNYVEQREFADVDNLEAAVRYLSRAGKSTLPETIEALWRGGMRPPDEVYASGKLKNEEQAKRWVAWRFKQAVGRHVRAAKPGHARLLLKDGFLSLPPTGEG